MQARELDEEELRRIAAGLGQRGVGGAALSVTDLDEVSDQGRLMQQSAQTTARDIGLMQARAQAEKTDRARVAAASRSLGFAKPSNTATEKFEKQANDIGNIQNLIDTWDNRYEAALPFETLANFENAVARTTGWGDEQQAEWWSAFKQIYENIERHEYFGSALTATEKAEWKRSVPNPSDTAEFTRSKLQTLLRLKNKLAAYSAKNALNKGWRPEYVYGVYQDVLPPEAWENLSSYGSSISKSLGRGSDLQRGSVSDMSDEEILEALGGY